MANAKKPKDLKKEIDKAARMFDVAKPGSTRANPTSRPIIVGHSTPIKSDPMVTPTAEEEKVIPEPELKPKAPKKVAVIEKAEEPKPKPVVEPEKTEEPEPVEEKKPESAAEEPKPESDETHSAVIATLTEGVNTKNEEQKQKDELAAKLEEMEKSVESKEFFLQIKTNEQKRNGRLIVLLLLLLVAVAAGVAYVMGPGSDQFDSIFAKKTTTDTTPAPVATKATTVAKPSFSDKTLGLSLNFPSDWKASTKTIGSGSDLTNQLIVVGPTLTLATAQNAAASVNPQIRIESVTNPGSVVKNASTVTDKALCKTDPISIAGSALYLVSTQDSVIKNGYYGKQAITSTATCEADSRGNVNLAYNVTLGKSTNSYRIEFYYHPTAEYLAKTKYDTVKNADFVDELNLAVKPDVFMSAAQKQAVEIIKSIKVL